jgi:hypothetical protein
MRIVIRGPSMTYPSPPLIEAALLIITDTNFCVLYAGFSPEVCTGAYLPTVTRTAAHLCATLLPCALFDSICVQCCFRRCPVSRLQRRGLHSYSPPHHHLHCSTLVRYPALDKSKCVCVVTAPFLQVSAQRFSQPPTSQQSPTSLHTCVLPCCLVTLVTS